MNRFSRRIAKDATTMRVLAISFILALILGCAYAKVRHSEIDVGQEQAFMEQNYDQFVISYSGAKEKPGAIRLDIKDDGVMLTGKGWTPVQDRAELNEIITNMKAVYRKYKGPVGNLGPLLFKILDDRNHKIGYVYAPVADVIFVRSDGANYSIDPITELDNRQAVYGDVWKRDSPGGIRGGRGGR